MGSDVQPLSKVQGSFPLPLIPVFIAYAIGIYLGHFVLPFSSRTLGFSLLAALVLWGSLIAVKRTGQGSWAAVLFFFILGIFSIHLYLDPPRPASDISNFRGFDRIAVEGIIDQPPHRSPDGTRLWIRPEKVVLPNHPYPVEGRLILFLQEEGEALDVGNRIRFLCKLYPPRGFHNPSGFSYERHLAFERIHTLGFLSVKNGYLKIAEGFKNPFLLRIENWRNHIRNFLTTRARPPSSSIFQALMLGEQENIPEEVKEHFILTGTAHLLAISGDQFGIVAFLSFSLLIWILKRSEWLLLSVPVRKWAAGLTIPFIILYAIIAGGGISVIRAMIMLITFLLSILFGRERNLLHTLGLAAFLILIFSPPSLFDISFQLSFLAVLSILYFVPRILHALKQEQIPLPTKTSLKKGIRDYFNISLLATGVAILGTAPFVALHFNRISPIGLVTNLFVIPWVGFLIVPLTLVASIFSFFFHPFASLLLSLNDFLTVILLKVLAFVASIPFSSIFLSTPTILEIIAFYLLLVSAVHLQKRKKMRYLALGLCAFFILDLAYWNTKDFFRKDLTLTFIDVGQGDSILVEFPKGKRMLIDGGGLYGDRFDTGKNVIAPFLWEKKIRRLDYLVLTHPDPDHVKGLDFTASHFWIGQFWDSGFHSDPLSPLKETLRRRRVERSSLNDGTPPQVTGGVTISFLNPPAKALPAAEVRDTSLSNNHSLVMKLRFRNVQVLLAGDIEKEAEYRLMRDGASLRADILKVPHHGSASSSTPSFLERVKPTHAIFSVGERNIGKLPHPDVLKRYEQLGAKIFRTDRHGAITVMTDGEKIEVKPFLKTTP